MLNEHEQLLGRIEQAQQMARGLYARGCQLDDVISSLRDSAVMVKDRVRAYKLALPTEAPKREVRRKAADATVVLAPSSSPE